MDDVVTHLPPVGAPELAGWYRSADVVVMPSYSESFGLVAIRRQAMGRAAAVQAESSDWPRTAAFTLESYRTATHNTLPVRSSWPSNAAHANASAAFRDPLKPTTLDA
jgi:hypothetical protein